MEGSKTFEDIKKYIVLLWNILKNLRKYSEIWFFSKNRKKKHKKDTDTENKFEEFKKIQNLTLKKI